MTYLVTRQPKHFHKYFVDSETKEVVCLCGSVDYQADKKDRLCRHCGKKFTLTFPGGAKKFCSYICSNTFKWKTRERNPAEKTNLTCRQCGKVFEVKKSYWIRINPKFCSSKCFGEFSKIKDGMTFYERRRKRKGLSKRGTPEWIEKIRATTKAAMLKPEINFKIRQLRSPLSLEHRIKISNKLAGKIPKNMMFGSNNFPNVHRGDYENSKGTMYFRSRWEANYALFLDFLVEKGEIKSWEYEPDTFIFEEIKFGTRSYLPDFKVFTNDGKFEYHEVKGYMDSKSKTKLKRMAKYYPEAKLILIDGKYYNDLKKKLGKTVGFYE